MSCPPGAFLRRELAERVNFPVEPIQESTTRRGRDLTAVVLRVERVRANASA